MNEEEKERKLNDREAQRNQMREDLKMRK